LSEIIDITTPAMVIALIKKHEKSLHVHDATIMAHHAKSLAFAWIEASSPLKAGKTH
jgi:hypothetical protein